MYELRSSCIGSTRYSGRDDRASDQQALCCSEAELSTLIVKPIVKPSKGSATDEPFYGSVESPDDDLYNAVSCMVSGVNR